MSDHDLLLQAALAKAITDAVSPEVQTQVFQDAIKKYLFSEERDGTHAISKAFEMALGAAARKLAQSIVEQPENVEKLKLALQEEFDSRIKDKALMLKVVSNAFRGY